MKNSTKMKKWKTAFLLLLANMLMLTNLNGENFGFTSMQLISTPHIPVRVGAKIVATDNHLYYIGNNNKICEYWNGGSGVWTGGGQLGTDNVQNGTQICNNGNELFYVGSSNRIRRLFWNVTSWQDIEISSTMIPVRSGTPLIYHDNVIYYVGNTNNKVCYISRINSNSAFNSNGVLGSTTSVSVLSNTTIVFVSDNPTTAHIYYIGINNRIYDIFKNGNTWTASTNYLASNVSLPVVRSGSQLTNDGNQLFYVGVTNNKIYELHWKDNITGWTGSLIMPSVVEAVKNPSQITYFDNHIYYIGTSSRICDLFRPQLPGVSWSGAPIGTATTLNSSSFSVFKGTTGHNIFSIGTDNRIKITLWDDVVCEFDADPNYCNFSICQGQTWHNGGLNTTANTVTSTSNIAIPVDPFNPANTPKSFYFIGSNGYANVFLRPILNDISKPGWILKRNDEFNSLAITQGLWDSQGPWAHGMCTNTAIQKEVDWNDMAYGKTDWSNFTVLNGIGTIVTKEEPVSAPFQGLTYGWATGLYHNSDFYGTCPYNYTNSYLCSGGINVGFACAPADQYCICGGNAPNNCTLGKIVNTCSCYTPKYPEGTLAPTMVLPKFYQKYGWFEIRCKVPRGKKMWSAFWAVNKGYYPSEIDFFEIEGNGKTMLSNIYYEDCDGQDPIGSANNYTYATGYRYYDDFYTYACEWGPTYIKWYLNNELIATETAPDRMQHDLFWIMVNTGVINVRAGCEPKIFPNNFDIDYIRIYQNPAWQ